MTLHLLHLVKPDGLKLRAYLRVFQAPTKKMSTKKFFEGYKPKGQLEEERKQSMSRGNSNFFENEHDRGNDT